MAVALNREGKMCRPPAISTANSEDSPPAVGHEQLNSCTTTYSPQRIQQRKALIQVMRVSTENKKRTHMAQRRSMVVHIVSTVADRQQLVERLHVEGSVRQHSTLQHRAFNSHMCVHRHPESAPPLWNQCPVQVAALQLRADIFQRLKVMHCRATLGAALVPDVKHSTAAPLSTARSASGAPLCRLTSCCAGTAWRSGANFSKASPAGWCYNLRVHSQQSGTLSN
jgi:hypothetical protein